MIRIFRCEEPPELIIAREDRLPSADAKVLAGEKLERSDLAGYKEAREALYVSQHRKCAYCEDSMKMPYEPVEHFRPALRAKRGAQFPEYGYWWLAWTWENLLFACSVCNSSHKKDFFPLADGSAVLHVPDQPPGQEVAVLVDPADSSDPHPMDLIVFRPVADRWIPTGRNGDPRGAEIVRLLGLDSPSHLPRYKDHVDEYLMPYVTRLNGLRVANDVDGFQAEWARALRHVRPVRPWSALSHDVLDYFFPAGTRTQLAVVLNRP